MGLGPSSQGDMEVDLDKIRVVVKGLIDGDKIVIFSKTTCPYCRTAKSIFDGMNQRYTAVELDRRDDCNAIQTVLEEMTGARTVPRIFVGGECLGGCSDVKKLFESGKLAEIVEAK
ncbi:glutaredoxin-like [Cryptotermes secundus]|uniref:glutaredoxin-like n=1 Tax=Cryptotermes secundus TaxID=105785 RepID=UPI000CD7DAEE|nr:glutaredoxin-like [Cryptotermes secundus]